MTAETKTDTMSDSGDKKSYSPSGSASEVALNQKEPVIVIALNNCKYGEDWKHLYECSALLV